MFDKSNRTEQWNSKKLIALSNNLAQGYHLGFNDAKSEGKADSWNAEKFIKVSRYLSSAYGIDF